MMNRGLEHSWMIPHAGDMLAGKYVVEGVCGRGGLAVVLSAQHVGLAQRVAIKLLLPEWAGDHEIVRRFEREGRAATRIRSEHVTRVFDVGTLDSGAPYIVLEYLDGHNLDDVVAMWGPLPVPMAIDWLLQAAEAIAEAHAHGIVHRDLKPANLFLTQRADGSACIKVLDFGLSKLTDPRMFGASAKLTRPSDVLGSPHYMAPEQLRATCDSDLRVDLWAMGAVLHELLTAQTPFGGDTMPELYATVLTRPPPRLSDLRAGVAAEVETAVLRCLEKDPNARFSTVAELARAISPYGSDAARASSTRIERVTESGARVDELTTLLPPPEASVERETWPSEPYIPMRASSATVKVAAGSFLICAGVLVGGLQWMYSSVHQTGVGQGIEQGVETSGGRSPLSSASGYVPPLPPAPTPAADSAASGVAPTSKRVEAPAPASRPRKGLPPPRPRPEAPLPHLSKTPSPKTPSPAERIPSSGDLLFEGRK